MIDAAKVRYGDIACPQRTTVFKPVANTARAIFYGPAIVFGGITARYRIDKILKKAFGENDGNEILSLAWYLASEGGALYNSDVWLGQYETPAGRSISSQEITRLLDRVIQDGIMTFYKEWLKSFKKTGDKILYDLTSISWYGQGINMAGWGHNRDKEALPQVNYALLCARNTAMPLFAWPLDGSVTDVKTLQNTLQFLEKLNYKPDCLMMDRGFSSLDNIAFMQRKGYIFLQALRVNANWIYDIIDAGRAVRLRPDSMVKAGDRIYYVSTSKCQCVVLKRVNKRSRIVEEAFIYL
jgi:transposase